GRGRHDRAAALRPATGRAAAAGTAGSAAGSGARAAHRGAAAFQPAAGRLPGADELNRDAARSCPGRVPGAELVRVLGVAPTRSGSTSATQEYRLAAPNPLLRSGFRHRPPEAVARHRRTAYIGT